MRRVALFYVYKDLQHLGNRRHLYSQICFLLQPAATSQSHSLWKTPVCTLERRTVRKANHI